MKIEDCTDVIVSWAEREGRRPRRPPRQNVRLLLGTPALAARVRERLESMSGPNAWYVVRTSADGDAVRERHGRPTTRPPQVTETTPLLYLVFWSPGLRTADGTHDANAQSLADLDAVDVRQMLSSSYEFNLPLELLIEAQCSEAALAWPDAKRDLAREHLVAAWGALRFVLREQAGGKERSLPFVTQLEDYVAFLRAACVPSEEWAATPIEARPGRLLRSWGDALPILGMFKVPALGDLLGFGVDRKLPKKPHREILERELGNMLAENLDAAADHHQLGERIAGKSSVAQRLAAPPVTLAQDDPDGAARALLDFCTARAEEALSRVEWLFRKDPAKKRGESQGLKGLLIQRGARQRRDPVEKAVTDTAQFLDTALAGAPEAQEAAQKLVEMRRIDVQSNAKTALRMAAELEALGNRQVPDSIGDAALRRALDDAIQAGKIPPATCESLARSWRALTGDSETTITREPSLLLGLVRVCASYGERFHEGCKVVLQLHDEKGGALGREHVLETSAEGLDRLRRWLHEGLATLDASITDDADAEESPDDVDDDLSETTAVRVDVGIRTKETTTIGQFRLGWNEREADRWNQTRQDTLRAWVARSAGVHRPAQDLASLFADAGQPINGVPDPFVDAWLELYQALGTDACTGVVAALGPLPSAQARKMVDAWSAQLARAGGVTKKSRLKQLNDEARAAYRAGDFVRGELLDKQIASLEAEDESEAPLPQASIRACLRAMTGILEHQNGARTLYLTPYHPLVLRLRVLAEDVLWKCLLDVVRPDAQAESAAAIADALDGWGLPEPSLMYGGFWEGEPLAFDSWTRGGFPRFVLHQPALGADLEKLGVEPVRSTLEHYLSLHPSARDRLSVRTQADADGRWAFRLVTSLLEEEDARIDVALVTSRTIREATYFERGAHATEQRRLLEMADDGMPPRVRFRRDQGSSTLAHVAISVGTSASVFTPKLGAIHVDDNGLLPTWSPQRLFEAVQWEARENGLVSGRPRFDLELRVARAIAYGARGGTDIFLERVSIDPSVVRDAVSALHHNAHWLVVVTRHPVHRVIESAGEDVAVLLDFRTRSELGRPLHICTSMGRDQFEFDLRRLRAALSRLLDTSLDTALIERIVRASRRFAPGVAMTCTGTTSLTYVQGLVGLLLTREATRGATPSAALPIDQHGTLLSAGTSNMRSDILVVEDAADGVWLRVFESKVTKNDPQSVLADGREQVVQTCRKLGHFERQHPLALRVREDLARAIDVQAEISGEPDIRAVARAVRDATRPIRVAPVTKHEVHVWSLRDAQVAPPDTTGDRPRAVLHGRAELMDLLRTI